MNIKPLTEHGCWPLCRDCKNARQRESARVARHRRWERDYRLRAASCGRVPKVESFTAAELVAKWGNECIYCGGAFEELDHYIPIAAGGDHSLLNCRPSCNHCNTAKADLVPDGKGHHVEGDA